METTSTPQKSISIYTKLGALIKDWGELAELYYAKALIDTEHVSKWLSKSRTLNEAINDLQDIIALHLESETHTK